MTDRPIIFQKIHRMLLRGTTPDGKIDRHRLFEIIAERIGRIEEKERNILVSELKNQGVILGHDKFSFTISK